MKKYEVYSYGLGGDKRLEKVCYGIQSAVDAVSNVCKGMGRGVGVDLGIVRGSVTKVKT